MGLAVVAVAVRFLHCSQLFFTPIQDMLVYMRLGQISFSSGISQVELEDLLFTQPAYYWLVGAVCRFFGEDHFRLVMYIQAIMDGFTLLLVAYVGRWLFNHRAALLSAFLYALFAPSIRNAGGIMTESLSGFTLLACIASLVRYVSFPAFTRAAMIGASCALSIYVRSNVALVFGVLIFTAAWRVGRQDWRLGIKHCCIAVFVFAVLVAPLIARNSYIAGRFVSFVSNSEIALIHGNHPSCFGWMTGSGDMPEDWVKQFSGKSLATAMPIYAKLAREFIYEHPAYVAFTLVPTKLYHILTDAAYWWKWQGGGATGTADDYPFGPYLRIPLIGSSAVLWLGLTGFLVPTRFRAWWLLPSLVFVLIAPLAVATIQGRYRYPAELTLILSAGAALDRILPSGANRRGVYVRGSCILLAIVVCWSLLSYVRFGGVNLLKGEKVIRDNLLVDLAVNGELPVEAPTHKPIRIATLPIHGGQCSHLAVRFETECTSATMRPDGYGRPVLETAVEFYDHLGRLVSKDGEAGFRLVPHQFSFGRISTGFGRGWASWRILTIPANARRMALSFSATGNGRFVIRKLSARGPLWYGPHGE